MPKLRPLAGIFVLAALLGCAAFGPQAVTPATDAATATPAATVGTVPAAASAMAASTAGEHTPPEATGAAPVADWQGL